MDILSIHFNVTLSKGFKVFPLTVVTSLNYTCTCTCSFVIYCMHSILSNVNSFNVILMWKFKKLFWRVFYLLLIYLIRTCNMSIITEDSEHGTWKCLFDFKSYISFSVHWLYTCLHICLLKYIWSENRIYFIFK